MDEALRGVFRDVLGVSEADYRDELSCLDVHNWDSVLHLTLLLALEQTFGVSFEPQEALGLTSVGTIKEALQRKLEG